MNITVLDPVQKSNHICKFWGANVYDNAMKHAEDLVYISSQVNISN